MKYCERSKRVVLFAWQLISYTFPFSSSQKQEAVSSVNVTLLIQESCTPALICKYSALHCIAEKEVILHSRTTISREFCLDLWPSHKKILIKHSKPQTSSQISNERKKKNILWSLAGNQGIPWQRETSKMQYLNCDF